VTKLRNHSASSTMPPKVRLDTERLRLLRNPIQETVDGIPSSRLGLGHSAPDNLELRKILCRPGAPYGGLGVFEPPPVEDAEAPTGSEKAPTQITAETVRNTKLEEFRRCAGGEPSIYFWALQPIFDTQDDLIGAEILVRARNGSDSAPFEDLKFIMDPTAPEEVREVYALWKAVEVVTWSLRALQDYPVLQNLRFISANIRPLDLHPSSMVFREVSQRFKALAKEDRELLNTFLCIEVTEDQQHPQDILESFQAWKDLGFRCWSYDDTIGDKACDALGMRSENLHTTSSLKDLVGEFWLVKVDIEWAGHMIFLCHPSIGSRPALKAEVLERARQEDLVYVPQGPGLKNTLVKHSEVLAEFASWARQMISKEKHICIELTVRQEDENCAHSLRRLHELGLDIFGADSRHFCIQGGLCGAKAFEPQQLAASAEVEMIYKTQRRSQWCCFCSPPAVRV